MRKRTKRFLATLLAAAMVLQQGSALGVLAGETEPASETRIETESETNAPKTTVETSEDETKDPETQAETTPAATEPTATPDTEPTAAPDAEAGTEPVTEPATEPVTESATEPVTESAAEPGTEPATEAATETEEPATEQMDTEETEPETEEAVVLEASVMQEVFQKTVEDVTVPMVKYTVKVANKAEKTAAEGVSLKVLLADALSYKKEDGETPELVSFESLGKAIEAAAFTETLTEEEKAVYANGGVVIWKDQTIAAGEEKTFAFCAEVKDGQTDVNALKNLWFVNGEAVAVEKIQWANTEQLQIAEKELPSEFVYSGEDGMTVTAVVSDPNAFPEGTVLIVEPLEVTEEDIETAKAELEEGRQIAKMLQYDIRFEYDGQEIEPPEGVTVDVSIAYNNAVDLGVDPEAAGLEMQVLHEKDNGETEEVVADATISEDGTMDEVQFTAESFSKFTFTITNETSDLFISLDGFENDHYTTGDFYICIAGTDEYGNVKKHAFRHVLVEKGTIKGAEADGKFKIDKFLSPTGQELTEGEKPALGESYTISMYMRHKDCPPVVYGETTEHGNEAQLAKIEEGDKLLGAYTVGAIPQFTISDTTTEVSIDLTRIGSTAASKATVMSGLGAAMNFGAFVWSYKQNSDVEATIAAHTADIDDYYNFDRQWKDYDNTITIGKDFQDEKGDPVNGRSVTIKLYRVTTEGEEYVAEITKTVENGHADFVFNHETAGGFLIHGTYHFYEYIDGKKIENSGVYELNDDEKVTVTYGNNRNLVIENQNFDNYSYFDDADAGTLNHARKGSYVVLPESEYADHESDLNDGKTSTGAYVVPAGTEGFPTINFADYFGTNGEGGGSFDSLSQSISTMYSSDSAAVYYMDASDWTKDRVWDFSSQGGKFIIVNVKASAADSPITLKTFSIDGTKVDAEFGNGTADTNILFNFYCEGGTAYTGEITNESQITGTVFAPAASVAIGGGNVGGRVIAKTVTGNKSEIHEMRPDVHSVDVPGSVKNQIGKHEIKGSLTVTKSIVGDLKAGDLTDDQKKAITFEVYGPKSTEGEGSLVDSFNYFDIQNGSREIKDLELGEYVVKETNGNVDGYTVETTYSVEGGKATLTEATASAEVTVTNTYTQKKGDLSVKKTVVGKTGDKTKNFHFKVTLDDETINGTYGDMTFTNGVAEFTLKDGETKTATNLPAGVGYTVIEEEANAGGYTTDSTGTSGKITTGKTEEAAFTNTYQTVSKSVEKIWVDGENQDGLRPDSIQVQLKADGAPYGDAVTLNKGNGWKHDWTDLPKVDATTGKDISYTVEEVGTLTGYTSVSKVEGDKTTITNTHAPEEVSAQVKKIWKDGENSDGKRPGSIKVTLYADGKATEHTVTLSEANNWTSQEITGLAKNKNVNGKAKGIEYTWEEENLPDGYTLTGTSKEGILTTLTNTYAPDEVSAQVKKVWDDDENRDGKRPDSIKVTLYADGEATEHTVTLNESNHWTSEIITGLEKNKNVDGEIKEIEYTWHEDNLPDGYTMTTGKIGILTTLTNTYTTEKVSAQVKKVWNDDENRDGKRPDSITVTLLADGEAIGHTVTLNEENNWTSNIITGLAKNKNVGGEVKEIEYTWHEDNLPEGYELTDTSKEGIVTTLTNTYTPEEVSAQVKKVWDDDGNRDGLRPEDLTLTLYADNEATTHTVTLNAENNWTSKEITGLAKNKNVGGEVKEIEYTWHEDNLPEGYELTDTSKEGIVTTLTNTYTPEEVSAQVKKVWDDDGNRDGLRPEDLTLTLYADNEATTHTVTLNAENNWTSKEITGLAKNKNVGGEVKEIEYTWHEDNLPEGYELTDTSKEGIVTTLTNTYTPEEVSAQVQKVWDDDENRDGLRPEDLTLTLYADNEATTYTVTLNEENNWTSNIITGLAKNKNVGGEVKEIEYTWHEDNLLEGYELTDTSTDGIVTTLTNTHDIEKTSKEVEKIWVDGENQKNLRPEKIEVQLLADGVPYGDKAELNADNDWKKEWTELPKKAAGKDVEYTVEEISKVPGYTTTYATDETTGKVTITNTITSVKVSKVDVATGAELEGAHIQILDKDGNVVEEWDSTKEAHEVKGLKTGETYTLKETVAPDGYTLTAETTFTLNEDGTVDSGKTTTNTKDGVLLVEDSFNKISILKVDESGEALKGAKLVIKDAEGAIVGEPWKSGSKAHDITGLAKGSYTLSEIEAPKGYQVSADVPFEITGKEAAGQTIEVKMTDEKIPESATYSLTVTKNLRLDGITSDIGIRDAVFYVALFSDEAKTQRVSSVKQIVFKNQISSSVTFDNLSAGTYYVGETDENGTLLVSKMVNDRIIFYPEYTGEGKVLLEGDEKNAIADFTNVYVEFTDDLYLSGQLKITKKILINGEEGTSDATYYAGVFNSPDMSEPLEIVPLELGGGSSTSYTVTNLPIGNTIGSSMTYYVTETDENGVPLDPEEVTEFEVSVDKSEIILDANNSRQEVVITNSFTEKETETEVPKKEAPKTGDDTNFMRYLLMMALSAGVCAVAFEEKRRKARRVRK